MNSEIFVVAGGAFDLIFAVFHLFFWRLFDWKEDLKHLTFVNQAVMQILNLCLTFVFLIFAYISLFHTLALLTTNLGKTMLVLISIFWFLRAVQQIIFFGLKRPISLTFFIVFLIGSGLYFLPIFL